MKKINIYNDDSLNKYDEWKNPICIISDGAYGVSGFDGDTKHYSQLNEWYEPHIKKWSEKSTPQTTLWFWNTEIGWASIHPILEDNGWLYRGCVIWDKGKGHIAGNVNTQTIRRVPPVTEIIVQYVRKPVFLVNNQEFSMQDWLRQEWIRSGLPLSVANKACGIKNAATRKYLTKDHLWYMPPGDMYDKLSEYANKYGKEEGKPYFSLDGKQSLSGNKWEQLRAKFKCDFGITNVWQYPPVRGEERIKIEGKALHPNQKPLELVERCIRMTTDEKDVVWEPFGGLMTGMVACQNLNREGYSCEINPDIFDIAKKRLGL